ncbi:MAG: hypothetical protein JXQ73_23885 [Phycisphaerae bacterium]|nr:hypothetical protein [Phycisphaerae bacterium]
MITKRRLAISLFGLALATWIGGCQEGTWGGQAAKLNPHKQQLGSTDVPVPEGFEMDEASSEDKSAGGWRFIRHTYKGGADPQLVRAFYREHMPMSKWTMLDDEMKQGQYTMHFKNDQESCEIVISRIKEKWTTKTKLVVEVSPVGQGKVTKQAPSKS